MILVILTGFLVAASWLSLVGLGAVVMWRGFRGRAADRHLHCRRCGYALVGESHLPPRCAECGLVIDGPRRCRSSPRVRRWSLVATGAMTIVALVAPLGLLYWPALVKPAAAAAAVPKNPAAAPRPLGPAPQSRNAPRTVVIPYVQEQPAGRTCPICGQAPMQPWHVHPRSGGANGGAGSPRSEGAETEGPPAPAAEPEPEAEAEAKAEPGDGPAPWRHLRNINGCCPNCGVPIVTPNKVTVCRRCGVDLAK